MERPFFLSHVVKSEKKESLSLSNQFQSTENKCYDDDILSSFLSLDGQAKNT